MPSKTSPAAHRIADSLKARRVQPCYICRQQIDYDLPARHPEAFTVEHIKPRSTHPHLALDPSNCAPAHARCNKARGNRDETEAPGLGVRSQEW